MSRICNCPNPPGGQVICDNDQLAMCSFENGEVVSGCFSRPANLLTIPSLNVRVQAGRNWALSLVTGTRRAYDQPIQYDELALLRSGTYTHSGTGKIVNFTLPKDLDFESPRAAVSRNA